MRAIIASLLCLASVGAADAQELAKATFAGGCFWCMEPPFDTLDGVVSTTSGYTGGQTANPTYEQVSAGKTGHTEAVEIVYDPRKVTYARLLDVFWRNIDPLTADAQFCDKGSQYRAGIFCTTRRSGGWRRHRRTRSRSACRSRSSPRSRPRRSSGPPRNTTRTTTRRTRFATSSTAPPAAGTRRLEAIWGPDAKGRAGAR